MESATLAAFVDGRLEAEDRARVIAHLASCPDCAELAGGVIGVGDVLANAPAAATVQPKPVLPSKNVFWTGRRGMAAVGGFVALAASVVLIMLPRGTPLASLVTVVGDERLIVARPTGGFRYGPLRSPVRGSSEPANLPLMAEAARLRERAIKTGAAADLHAAGVAQLLAGDVANGIAALESAGRAEPQDPAIQADLGAAYMTRFVDTGDHADAAPALAAFERTLRLDPKSREVWFNKAVLLERLGRTPEALSAWDSYLALPAEPGWRDEAVRQQTALRQKGR